MSGTSVEGGDVFRVIQLAGPTAREAEEQVAKYIEEQIALYDQRDLGARTRRDGNGGLRIDFTYDAAMPPVAMEITALVQPDLRALGTELLKLEAELQEVVFAEDLGAWPVSVRVGTDVRRLRAIPRARRRGEQQNKHLRILS